MRLPRYAAVLVAPALAVATFLPAVLRNGFVDFDDPIVITQNPLVAELSPRTLLLAFSLFDPELYVPLTTLSLQLTAAVGGMSPVAFHAGNLALHASAAVFAWGIARRAVSPRAALLAAALFAVHPLQTEAVLWASARKDVLSGALALASAWAWLRSRERDSGPWYAASLAAFCCALLAKVSAAPAFLLFPLLAPPPGGRPRTLAPFAVAAAVAVGVAFVGKAGHGGSPQALALIAPLSAVDTLRRIFFPLNLSVVYPLPGAASLLNPRVASAIAAVFVLTGAAVMLRRRAPGLWKALFAFTLLLLPGLWNAARGPDTVKELYLASDRYAYLALLPVLLLIAEGVFRLPMQHRLRTAACAAATVVLMFYSAALGRAWHDTESLFLRSIAAGHESATGWGILGTLWAERGDLQAGLAAYDRSLRLRPTSQVLANLGILAERAGDVPQAERRYRSALALRPTDAVILYRLGRLRFEAGDEREALELLRRSVDARATPPEAEALLTTLQERLEK